MEQKFKPFDRVLVREDKESEWSCELYSHYDNVLKVHCVIGALYNDCIPYEGNEHLLGTTDSPQPKRWRAKKGESYWSVSSTGASIELCDERICYDDNRYHIGNYFRTEIEADEMAVKLRALFVKAMLKGGE